MEKYLSPPFVKVIQTNAQPPLSDMFDSGQVVLVPLNVAVSDMVSAEEGAPVFFTPIFWFVDYCTHNPWNTRGKLDFIRERVTDPNHPIAVKARDAELREETIEDPVVGTITVRHVEHLNFIILIESELCGDMPAMVSFSKSNYRAGNTLCTLIKARGAALYSGRYELSTRRTTNEQGTWYKMQVANPRDGNPWVSEERQAQGRNLYESFKLRKDDIVPDYEQGETVQVQQVPVEDLPY